MANIYVPWKSVGEESERATVSEGDTINNVEEVKEKGKTALQRCRLDTQSTCIVYTIHAYDMASLRLVAKPFSFSKRLVG